MLLLIFTHTFYYANYIFIYKITVLIHYYAGQILGKQFVQVIILLLLNKIPKQFIIKIYL